jgi:hypothetical protein
VNIRSRLRDQTCLSQLGPLPAVLRSEPSVSELVVGRIAATKPREILRKVSLSSCQAPWACLARGNVDPSYFLMTPAAVWRLGAASLGASALALGLVLVVASANGCILVELISHGGPHCDWRPPVRRSASLAKSQMRKPRY